MTKLDFLFIILFIHTNSQIKNKPIFLSEDEYPFVLSTRDNYYYVITNKYCLKIQKDSGIKENTTDQNLFSSSDYVYITNNSDNNYLYYDYSYYTINYNKFMSFEHIEVNPKNTDKPSFKRVGGIVQENFFIIYGYNIDSNHLIFVSIPQNNRDSKVNLKVNSIIILCEKI